MEKWSLPHGKEEYINAMKPNKIYIAHDIGKTELTPEEAKELLSDTELPSNMKKIIEGEQQ